MGSFSFSFLAILLFSLALQSLGLNTDGVLLMSFRFSVFSDPLSVLQTWRHDTQTPCSWRGVTCNGESRVTELSLPSSLLLGSLPSDLGLIENLRRLDLSNNLINGPLPLSIFQAKNLQFLDLSMNSISGSIPEEVGRLQGLQTLNLSDNALAGKLPASLSSLSNLTVVSLRRNYFSGDVPGGFRSVEMLDLSSNMLNGSLPSDFGGDNLHYLNVSYNWVSGGIPPNFAAEMPENATLDFSHNNLTGRIPGQRIFQNQEAGSFDGNPALCGEPSRNPCPVPSSPGRSPGPSTPPAVAGIPRTMNPSPNGPSSSSPSGSNPGPTLKPGVIIGIVVGGVAGVGILALGFAYMYKVKKKSIFESTLKKEAKAATDVFSFSSSSSSSSEFGGLSSWSCLRKTGDPAGDEEDEDEEDDSETTAMGSQSSAKHTQRPGEREVSRGTLVTLNRDRELELETLLKASAYILGASGSSIMYKAVLDDGTALAVRRLSDPGPDRLRDFESQVRAIAKLVHPNLVSVRGFFWGADEKLIVYDFVPNGSLANARYSRKPGSSPRQLPWEVRVKIAKGLARGLSYLHEKKHVHGNLKPSKVLLGFDMEPKIGGTGLERLLTGETSRTAVGSARIFGSHRSTTSREDVAFGPTVSPSPSSATGVSPYHSPESFRSLRPNPKWDVYSFGVIFLELITGKVAAVEEVSLALEEGPRAMRMADVAVRAELEGKEEILLACLRLGVSCASQVAQRRPSMKEVSQALDKLPVTGGAAT